MLLFLPVRASLLEIYQREKGEGIKARRLRHFGKLKYTLPASCNPRAAILILPRGLLYLVDCGSAAVGVEVPQYKPFYTVP